MVYGEKLSEKCAKCPKKTAEDISPYTWKLLRLRRLKLAGYPFKANDLSIEEWEDMGKIDERLASWIDEKAKSKQ